jgi:micrococcal nuclease
VKKYLLAIIALSLFSIALSEKLFGTIEVGHVVSVYDGDTFTANLSKSFHPIIRDSIGIRIYGVDTPEMKDKSADVKAKAVLAKNLTASILNSGKKIKLVNVRRDKYFRICAEVWVGPVCIADTLIKAGLGRPYFGETKDKW